MKFGQMASYLSPSMPPKAQRILARLQSQSQPLAYPSIEAVIEQEFNRSPQKLFDYFEEKPFAAASIGQVHRAKLNGKELAVKVQYPDVDKLMDADFKTIKKLARLFFMFSPLDTKSLMEELVLRVREECDYQAEARNQLLFSRLADDSSCMVPAVIEEKSSQRVLTTEMAPGLPFYQFCDQATQEQKNQAAAIIFDFAFSCIFKHCVYNADPHPGNYLFDQDGRVFFIDFGCIKRFEASFIDTWKRLALCILNGDRKNFAEAANATGMVAKPEKFDYQNYWELFQYIYDPYLSQRPFTFTHEYVKRSYDVILFRNPNKFKTTIPPDWLFVNRLQWGLNSVLAYLNASAPWGEIFRRVVESPTRPAWK
jgi:predicted unusual protein kinase regulating ubiquinone biosynthesis (AarF/ABC1/UbiB family)